MEQAPMPTTAAVAPVRASRSFSQWDFSDLLHAGSRWIIPAAPRPSPMIEEAMGRRSETDILGEKDGRES